MFLLDKGKGEYWSHVKNELDKAPSQREYNRLLDFENRDLQIREGKDRCHVLFRQILAQHPDLSKDAPYAPTELFMDFFDENRAELDTHGEWSETERDRREIQFLSQVSSDLKRRGPASIYMKDIFGVERFD